MRRRISIRGCVRRAVEPSLRNAFCKTRARRMLCRVFGIAWPVFCFAFILAGKETFTDLRYTNHVQYLNIQTQFDEFEKENALFHVGFRKGKVLVKCLSFEEWTVNCDYDAICIWSYLLLSCMLIIPSWYSSYFSFILSV